ncbi:MAG: hypothetical protein ABIP89_04760 [Polyangiaceae bacterium]
MMLSWRRLAWALTFPALLATACSSTTDSGEDESSDEVNYRSTAGQEFNLSTTVTFPVADDVRALTGDAKEKAIVAVAEQLRASVTAAISAELDRIWPEDKRITRAGVAIQFRQASATYSDLVSLDGGARYSVVVSGEFAAVKDIEKKLPLKTVGDKTFLPVTTDVGAGSEELQVFLTPVERSLNAYPRYLALFEDGLDISVHFGGDHNDPPQDIDHARSVYDDLIASGFKSPVAKFEDLKLDSAPLASQVQVKGALVDVRVRIVHEDMTPPDARQPLVDAYKQAVKTADVVIYDGHAGRQLDYSGVVLAYKPARVSIPADTFKDIEATTKQQIYLFNGCETYTGYADKLYENPNKNPENADVITTANFSAIQPRATQVLAFIHSLIDGRTAASKTWIPRSWDSVLTSMNTVGERSWVHVYGVTGIDDDPRASPLADTSKLGAECTTDADCGAADSRCVPTSSTKRVCGIACADTSGCPTGTKCLLPANRTSVDDMQCLRR